MNKKSILVLLIFPFLLSLLFFITSNFLFTKIEGDISNIIWNYRNYEAFNLNEEKVKLEATPILANEEEDVDATLIWTVQNNDGFEDPHAFISIEDEESYLNLSTTGEVKVTCTNTSGNISKSFNCRIYEDGTIIVNTKRARSFNKIDSVDYYGEYDFTDDYKSKKASFYIDVEIYPNDLKNSLIYETSNNISYDQLDGKITVKDAGQAFIKFTSSALLDTFATYSFNVVDNGYNVYNYNQLLECTNNAKNNNDAGKIVCLQTNLSSLNETFELKDGQFVKKEEVTNLFGNFNDETNKFSFEDEVSLFESTYNTEYIDQYNEAMKGKDYISKKLIAAVHITNDFYGNGYVINLHDLTFPKKVVQSTDGNTIYKPEDYQLFKGPLPFVLIGNNKTPIIKAYGQDNVGFYVDGDNILLNDVNFKNCNFSNILQNNDYTGTVLEINGDGVVVQNSVISSGRTVIRSFSNDNLLIKNTLLEKGREFIAKIGSNEYEKINLDGDISFDYQEDGKLNHKTMSKKEFFFGSNDTSYFTKLSSDILFDGLGGTSISDELFKSYSKTISSVMNNGVSKDSDILEYKYNTTFEDTLFYQSGLFSLALDTLFNGVYLFDGSPVQSVLSDALDGIVYPNNIGGISIPCNVNLVGDTRFYDYKRYDQVDSSCLIYQDLTLFTEGTEIDLDSFFPIKKLFKRESDNKGYNIVDDNQNYYSTAIAKYGGGLNLSNVNFEQLDNKDEFGESLKLDVYSEVMNTKPSSSDYVDIFLNILGRCVPMASGFEPFEMFMYNGNKSNDGYLFGDKVSLDILRSRA